MCVYDLCLLDQRLTETQGGRGGRVVERLSVEGTRVRIQLLSLGNFVHPDLPVSFGRERCLWQGK